MTKEAKYNYESDRGRCGLCVAGIYQLKRLLDLASTHVLTPPLTSAEPVYGSLSGCRSTSESLLYYGFRSRANWLDAWHWKERFSRHSEETAYLNYVRPTSLTCARAHAVQRRIRGGSFRETRDSGGLELMTGAGIHCRIRRSRGCLLRPPTMPRLEGRIESFNGRSFKPYIGPHEPIDWTAEGRRRRTGATGIQVIAEDRRQVGETYRVPAAAQLERAA